MKSIEQKYIREVLLSFIYQRPFPDTSISSLNLAAIRKMTGHCLGVLQHVVPEEHFKIITMSETSAVRLQSVHSADYLKKEKVSAGLSGLLAGKNIPHAVIRGVATASCYPVPAVRSMSDIDILIPADCRDAVSDLLAKQGVPVSEHLRSQRVYLYKGIKIEVHERLITPNRFALQNAFFDDWPAHVKKIPAGNSGNICVLSPEYGMVADVFHALVHHDLEKLIYVADIACRIRHDNLDWKEISDLVKRLGIEDYFSFTLGYTAWILGPQFLNELPPWLAEKINRIGSESYIPFWMRTSGCDSLGNFLSRRRQMYLLTESKTIRFKLAWRMCFGEDFHKAIQYMGRKR